MKSLNIKIVVLLTVLLCAQTVFSQAKTKSPADVFWKELNKLCGKAFAGTVAAAPAEDTTFKGKELVMHVRSCEKNRIRIPFFVGADKSRTWVLTRRKNGRILLKHDHRHEDGKPDQVTMYGGLTSNEGSATRQMFPADDETVKVIAAAATNVWWMDLVSGDYFSYNLRRMGTERYFSIKFDLKKEVKTPAAPWGWQDKAKGKREKAKWNASILLAMNALAFKRALFNFNLKKIKVDEIAYTIYAVKMTAFH